MPDSDLILTKAEQLVREVRQLLDSPADRAALRHSLGRPPEDASLAVHRIIVRHLPPGQPDEATERAFYAVPAYLAAQPRQARDQDTAAGAHPPAPGGRRQNFGESLARAAFRAGPAASGRMDARLQLLARQDLDGLHRQLPRLVLHLRADLVRIDWPVLIRDLARWGRDPKQVAKQWMQAYYRTSERLTAETKHHDAAAAAGHGNEET